MYSIARFLIQKRIQNLARSRNALSLASFNNRLTSRLGIEVSMDDLVPARVVDGAVHGPRVDAAQGPHRRQRRRRQAAVGRRRGPPQPCDSEGARAQTEASALTTVEIPWVDWRVSICLQSLQGSAYIYCRLQAIRPTSIWSTIALDFTVVQVTPPDQHLNCAAAHMHPSVCPEHAQLWGTSETAICGQADAHRPGAPSSARSTRGTRGPARCAPPAPRQTTLP